MELSPKINQLLEKGVSIPAPFSIDISDEVHVDRISSGVTLHMGTRLRGTRTYIAADAIVGEEAPVTIDNCFVGPQVQLKGGYFKDAVFLMGAICGSGSHLREGTILEEHASIAHTVGLKQTILFPFVTLGSLINFCDCLMAGGTDRGNHSEVGSSYIHFNFSANQDKATPSLIGDVPRGVMLNQAPIFLGGQGGLVGPSRIAYGTVLAAGSIFRGDQLEENRMVFAATAGKGSLPFKPDLFRNFKRVLFNNFFYMTNLIALQQWYRLIRVRFIGPLFPQPLFEGTLHTLQRCIQERERQLDRLIVKLNKSEATGQLQRDFCIQWPKMKSVLSEMNQFQGSSILRQTFMENIDDRLGAGEQTYLSVIKYLTPAQASVGSQWLDSIVQYIMAELTKCLPELVTASKNTESGK